MTLPNHYNPLQGYCSGIEIRQKAIDWAPVHLNWVRPKGMGESHQTDWGLRSGSALCLATDVQAKLRRNGTRFFSVWLCSCALMHISTQYQQHYPPPPKKKVAGTTNSEAHTAAASTIALTSFVPQPHVSWLDPDPDFGRKKQWLAGTFQVWTKA